MSDISSSDNSGPEGGWSSTTDLGSASDFPSNWDTSGFDSAGVDQSTGWFQNSDGPWGDQVDANASDLSWVNYDYSNVNLEDYEACSMASDVAVTMVAEAPPGELGAILSPVPELGIAAEVVREMLESSDATREVAKEVLTEICNIAVSEVSETRMK